MDDVTIKLTTAKGIKTVFREISADLETPISIYLKLRDQNPSFLLESVEGSKNIARYSFIGVRPSAQYILRKDRIEIIQGTQVRQIMLYGGDDPTTFLQNEMDRFRITPKPGLPRFVGGLVGYMGYETIRYFEPTLKSCMQSSDLPDAVYLLADTIVAFDHARQSLFLIANVLDGDEKNANQKLDEIIERIKRPLPVRPEPSYKKSFTTSNEDLHSFIDMVEKAKDHILKGDIFQVVLSQRFERVTNADAFEVYRSVRRLNPSPYMFFFDFGILDGQPFYLAGASPEMFVRLENQIASLRPIAGTRRRGNDEAADQLMSNELMSDPKERAEHVMLVDLGRNDLGRVCEYGSIKVTEFSKIERYSHVMHLVSNVEGVLRPDLGAFDLVRAAFPAGTVSGAPKIRAVEIIAELEIEGRGPYAGMIGYFGFDGAMDTCLAIRTMIGHGQKFSVQAGAGIVADSNPEAEYQETVNKAAAMLHAIEMAESNS